MNSDLPFTALVALGAGIGQEAPPAKQSFDEWLRTAKGGEVYVYAVYCDGEGDGQAFLDLHKSQRDYAHA